ncbi:MAG: hypothetical protein RR630_08190 [Coprobacillus sp.]
MNIIVSIALLIIDFYMAYIVYSDKRAEEYKCKKILSIDFIFLWLGVITTVIARVVTESTKYPDLLYFVVTNGITIAICWFLLLKDFYIDLKKLDKDILPYDQIQLKEIKKTYIRNGMFLIFYIVQIIVLVSVYK